MIKNLKIFFIFRLKFPKSVPNTFSGSIYKPIFYIGTFNFLKCSELKIQNSSIFEFELWMIISLVFCMRSLKFFFLRSDVIFGYPETLRARLWCIEIWVKTHELDGRRHWLAIASLGVAGQIEMCIMTPLLFLPVKTGTDNDVYYEIPDMRDWNWDSKGLVIQRARTWTNLCERLPNLIPMLFGVHRATIRDDEVGETKRGKSSKELIQFNDSLESKSGKLGWGGGSWAHSQLDIFLRWTADGGTRTVITH